MKYLIIYIFVLFTLDAFGHISPFALTEGKFLYNQNFNQNYLYEYTFNTQNNVQIQDIGIEFFNVGDDDTASIFFKIIEKNTGEIIHYSDTLIKEIYFQSIFIDVNKSLQPNLVYQFIIGSLNEKNDDKIHFFSANQLPSSSNEFPISVLNIYSDKSIIPTTKTENSPFITIGISSQTGIDFIAEKILKKYPANYNSKSFSTTFKSLAEFNISRIGLNYLDVGNDSVANYQFFIKDSEGNYLFKKDTIFKSIFKKKVDIPCNLAIELDKSYVIGLENLNIDDTNNVLLAYHTDSLPYLDNLNKIKILEYKRDLINDSLGIAFYLNFNNKTLSLVNRNKNNYKIEFQNEKIIIYFNNKSVNSEFCVFDINGLLIRKFITNENKIEIEKTILKEQSLYIIENQEELINFKIYNP